MIVLCNFKLFIEINGSWINLSTALENDTKIYSYRVDSVFNNAHKILGGLTRGLNENFEETSFYLFEESIN